MKYEKLFKKLYEDVLKKLDMSIGSDYQVVWISEI